MTQPALSKSLQRLEDHLGLQLAERSPRGLILTEEGRTIYDHARRVDAEMRYLELNARAVGANRRKFLRIGASPSWSLVCVPDLVDQISRNSPDLILSVRVELETELVRLLSEGELDIALCNTDLETRDHYLARETLIGVDVLVACRKDHPMIKHAPDRIDPLFDCDWVDYQNALDQSASDSDHIRSKIRGRIVKTSSWLNALMIASKTNAVLPLPTHVKDFLPKFDLGFVDGIPPLATFKAGIWYRRSFSATRTGRAFCEMAKSLMTESNSG